MNIFSNLFGKQPSETSQIMVKQIEEIFAYGKKKNLTGAGLPNGKFKLLGNLMNWKSEPYYYNGYKNIPAQDVPAHIKWSNNPRFAYIGIVNGQVEYRLGNCGESAYFICPITTDKKGIALINEIFNTWYEHLNLPHSLGVTDKEKQEIDKGDKMQLIKAYLRGGTANFFVDIFHDTFDIVIWVDWREKDDAIIQYCEDIIRTGQLTTAINDTSDEIGFEIFINYKGMQHKIPYEGKGADRDTTIITLNEVLKPDFEIRFCTDFDGSDTLAFLPLTAQQWAELEVEFGSEKVRQYFNAISKESKMFG